jgi:hypothetical protein
MTGLHLLQFLSSAHLLPTFDGAFKQARVR